MTDPYWGPLFEALSKIPGRTKQDHRKSVDDLIRHNELLRRQYVADVAVGLGAVDDGEMDPWAWLADYAAALPDTIVEKFLPGAGSGTDGAGVALGSAAQTLTGLVQDVQALQQAQSTGKTFVINFADYPNGESEAVGVPFDLNYTGTGTGRSVIVNGVSTWNTVADGDVQVIGRYNGPANDGLDTDTDSDYQLLQATAKWPMEVGATQGFCTRMSEDMLSFIYVLGYRPALFTFRCEVGCYVNGVKTVLDDKPAGFSLALSAKIGDFENSDPYRIEVFSGNDPIINVTDESEVSELGSDFRGWGYLATTAGNGAAAPAAATRVQCSDITA